MNLEGLLVEEIVVCNIQYSRSAANYIYGTVDQGSITSHFSRSRDLDDVLVAYAGSVWIDEKVKT